MNVYGASSVPVRTTMAITANKDCPRCRGTVINQQYLGSSEKVCLQCGHRIYLARRIQPEGDPGGYERRGRPRSTGSTISMSYFESGNQ